MTTPAAPHLSRRSLLFFPFLQLRLWHLELLAEFTVSAIPTCCGLLAAGEKERANAPLRVCLPGVEKMSSREPSSRPRLLPRRMNSCVLCCRCPAPKAACLVLGLPVSSSTSIPTMLLSSSLPESSSCISPSLNAPWPPTNSLAGEESTSAATTGAGSVDTVASASIVMPTKS